MLVGNGVRAHFNHATFEGAVNRIVVSAYQNTGLKTRAKRGAVIRTNAGFNRNGPVAGGNFKQGLARFGNATNGVEVQPVNKATGRSANFGSSEAVFVAIHSELKPRNLSTHLTELGTNIGPNPRIRFA